MKPVSYVQNNRKECILVKHGRNTTHGFNSELVQPGERREFFPSLIFPAMAASDWPPGLHDFVDEAMHEIEFNDRCTAALDAVLNFVKEMER